MPRRRSSSSVELPAGSAAGRAGSGEPRGAREVGGWGPRRRGSGYACAAAATAMPARVWGFMGRNGQ